MKKVIIGVVSVLVVGAGLWAFLLKPRADRTYGTVAAATVSESADAADDAAAAEPFYDVKHRWSELPKAGTVLLTFIVREPVGGGKAQDVEVMASAALLPQRAQAEAQQMEQNPRGVFRLPIHFTEPGDWEVRLSIQKGGEVVERRTIEVKIEE